MFPETLIVRFVDKNSILKLRPSVAVVSQKEVTEFFLSDIRKSVILEMDSRIAKMLFKFNGTLAIEQWMASNNLAKDQEIDIINLLSYLNSKHVMINIDENYADSYKTYPRVYSFLENFFSKQSEINKTFQKIQNSVVMVIGLGSVGTWVAKCLSMDGVRNFIVVDNDRVEMSNLHRQVGFTEKSVGQRKTESFKNFLRQSDPKVNVECIDDNLDGAFFQRHTFSHIDIIINCADYPTVDETSRIVGEYAMPRGIAHCIGGGYNLHQTLIGQIVIPGKTACLECFRKDLDEINVIDTTNIRKLQNKDRKIGSFPPLSSLSASITANEAFKYLAGIGKYCMTNNRVDFSTRDLNFHQMAMKRREDCEWCGRNGKYYKL